MKLLSIVAVLLALALDFSSCGDAPDTKNAGDNQKNAAVSAVAGNVTLVLSNGKTIFPDTATHEFIADDGGATITKDENGVIQYTINRRNSSDTGVLMNTLSTPKGKIGKLLLSDGTTVWLNAESSITYPTTFKARERKVTVRGEVYFDVGAGKPFLIKTYRDYVKPGTARFNVNSYFDERFIKTSLVEGVISVNDFKLQPGEAFENGLIIKTDAQQDVAWKDGYFGFDNVMVEEALKQIARWYDVTIQPDHGIPASALKGRIKRTASLQELINSLEGQNVHFKLQGKTLYVSPILR